MPVSKGRKSVLALVAVPLALVVALTLAWAADAWASTDRVARNVEVAGVPVGHLDADELDATLTEMAEQFPDTPVVIDAGEFEMTTTAGEVGLSLDVDTTAARVMALGRNDPLPTRPVRWLTALFGTRDVAAALDTDPAATTWTLAVLEGDRRTEPVEPTLEVTEDEVVLVPGEPGRAITLHDVVSALPATLIELDEPIAIEVSQTVTDPAIPDEAMAQLVEQANQITSAPIELVTGGRSVEIDGAEFRPGFGVSVEGTTPELTLDVETVGEVLLTKVLRPANPTGVRFEIGGGGPVPVGGEDAQVCCEPDAPQQVTAALLAGERRVELATRTLTAAEGREWAAGLGVREVIGSFTTNHPCCQSRVTNIHRMADILRGVLIPPGTTFSVNDTVGRRTVEKGFVEGGVIQDGEFTTDIGGGVSQFATTLFNAAFFGGLDIPVYKAHSKYISRYPFGREATLAYPSVDLKIRNDTPYGIVIWPSYTGTSITVDLWSTRTAVGAQTGQNKSSGCGSVSTERTRTFTDGRVETDTFRANYDCD